MLGRLSVAAIATCLMGATAFAQGAAPAPAPAATAPAPAPTDAQIAHIAYTAGALDVEVAKQSLAKIQAPAVKSFAEQMIRDHEAVNKQALELVAKLKVTPEDNDTSRAITAQIKQEEAKLAGLSGAAFDKEYISNEVAFHKMVNNALTTTLIPAATNPELKSFLEVGLKLFLGHQQHAEEVAASLK